MYKNEATKEFFQACEEGDTGRAQAALSAGANVNEVDRWKDETALHGAARIHNVEMVDFLLANGADPNARAWRGELGADPNARAWRGEPPLFFALKSAEENGREKIVDTLIAGGAEVDAVLFHEKTMLHVASERALTHVVATLLDKGADIERRTHGGSTAIQLAAAKGNADVVVELMRRGADLNPGDANSEPKPYTSALDIATYYGNLSIAQTIRAQMEARSLDATLDAAHSSTSHPREREDLGAPDPQPVRPNRPRL